MNESEQRAFIDEVNDWLGFYLAIIRIGNVVGSRERIYTPQQNIERAVLYKLGIKYETILTRAAGLRAKAIELAKNNPCADE